MVALGVVAGLVLIGLWAWWKDRRNQAIHDGLMRRVTRTSTAGEPAEET